MRIAERSRFAKSSAPREAKREYNAVVRTGAGTPSSIAAIEEGIPTPVLTTALYSRFASRGMDDFADRLLSAMRKQFGGHDEKTA